MKAEKKRSGIVITTIISISLTLLAYSQVTTTSSENAPNLSPCAITHQTPDRIGLTAESLRVKYPKEALKANAEGSVVLSVVVGRDGRTKDLSVSQSNPLFDKAARDAIRQWQFHPARTNGEAVEATFKVHIVFSLQTKEGLTSIELDKPTVAMPKVPVREDVYRLGPGITPPKATYHPQPVPSDKTRQRKEQTVVMLSFIVNKDGATEDVVPLCGGDPDLIESAIMTVQSWKFEPATKDGQPVPVQLAVETVFHSN